MHSKTDVSFLPHHHINISSLETMQEKLSFEGLSPPRKKMFIDSET